MNLREIARHLKLSPATVSLCLNHPDGKVKLSPKTIAQVQNYAQEIGYIPNQFARRIFYPGRKEMLGILLQQDGAIDRNAPLLPFLLRQLSSGGIEYQLFSCLENQLMPTIKFIRGMDIRRILILGISNQQTMPEFCELNDTELLFCDYRFPADIARPSCVAFAGIHLIQPGHQKLFNQLRAKWPQMPILAEENTLYHLTTEQQAFCINLGRQPKEMSPAIYGESLVEKVLPLLKTAPNIFVWLHYDHIAMGLMGALLRQGIKIPEQVQLLGYNDSDFCPYLPVALSSFHSPGENILQFIANKLLAKEQLSGFLKIEPTLIQRKSTLPIDT